jgi:hypothetical protein
MGAEEPALIKFLVDGLAQHRYTAPARASVTLHRHSSVRDATYFESQLKLVLDAEAEAFVKVCCALNISFSVHLHF